VSLTDLIAAGLRRAGARFAPIAAVAVVLIAAAPATAQAEPRETPEFSCSGVHFRYTGFPDLPGNTVSEKVRVDEAKYFKTRTFDGPEATDFFPVTVPAGFHHMDAFAKWNTNGVKGGDDQALPGGITCKAEPRFAVQKRQ